MDADERHVERAERRTVMPHPEARGRPRGLDVVRVPIDVAARAERLDTRHSARQELARARAVGADEQQPLARHQPHEATEREHHGIEIGVDVRVIELDVVHDCDVGKVLEELRRLVEEGAVVFVIEGDEYDSAFFDKTAKFLKYLPDIAVVNNVEFDHADIYTDFDAVMLAFRRLVRLVPRKGLLLVGADSAGARELLTGAVSRVQTFGTGSDVDWHAYDIETSGTATRFRVRHHGSPFGAFDMPLVGIHNVRNALAAIAVAAEVGIGAERIAEGLRLFGGIKRRLEVVGVADAVTVYDDFAHHPTAVAETLAGLRAANPDARIWAVFEPRSASSCRSVFQDDFAKAFGSANEVLIAPVFRSKLPEAERLSVPRLVRDLKARGQSAREAESFDGIVQIVVREHRRGDLVVLMSNGGFGGIHQKLLTALEGPREALA